MNVIILNNQATALVNFWTVLLKRLREEGHEVLCLVPEGTPEADDTLRSMGVRVRHYPLDRKGLNPVRDVETAAAFYRIFREEKPDVLYASTIKPVIYGIPMAWAARVRRRYAMITGLGYMFEADSLVKKALTCMAALLYRLSLGRARAVFFQNSDDVRTFRKWHCLPDAAHVVLTKGTGVDTVHFVQAPLVIGEPPVFLLIGRLLEAKGLYEYAEAARLVKARYPHARFQVLGPPEPARGGVPMETLKSWQAEGLVEYLGSTRDTRPFMAAASVIVLPSWREGMPCSLMEGMSTGRALIATDVPGCREVVRDGVNGFLVPLRDVPALAKAMEAFLETPELAASMGEAGRRMAEFELDAVSAANHLLEVMELCKTSPPPLRAL